MNRKRKPFAFFLWHRRLGLAGMLLLFVLSITGIMLNHTEEFKLDETSIESELLLNWYDINPRGEPISFQLNKVWISQWNQQLFFNGHILFNHSERLQGIAISGDIIAIALQQHVLLVDTNGEVIELIPVKTRGTINKIASNEGTIVLLDKQQHTYVSDTQLSHWKPRVLSQPLNWSAESNISPIQIDTLKKSFRGDGLNLEKFILDLHSGRIFNDKWGVYIMDATAILMMLLGISGTWVWWSRKLKMGRKKHYKKHH